MLLTGFAKREQRATSNMKNPSAWFLEALAGQPSTSGVSVNEQTAQTLAAVDGCLNVIAKTVAQVPLRLYRRTDNGREKAEGHPLYNVVRRVTNRDLSAFVWKERMQYHLSAWGNAYSFKLRNRRNEITELVPLLPDRTWPVRENAAGDSVLYYLTQIEDKTFRMRPDEVVHIPGFGFDGMEGRSTIRSHREMLGYALASQQYSSRFYRNGAQLRGVIQAPNDIQDPAKLQKQWAEAYGGPENQFKTAVLEQGMVYNNIGIPPEDAQFIETRKFQREEIATIFQVPLHFLGESNVKYNNRELEALDFVIYSMGSWFCRWEQELDRQLLRPDERASGLFFKFDPRSLLRGDHKSRAFLYTNGIQWGWLTRNEVRELEDMNKLPDLDEPLQPLNMGIAGEEPPMQPPPDDDDDEDDDEDEDDEANRLRAIRLGVIERSARREMSGLLKLREQNPDKADFIAAAAEFYRNHEKYMESALALQAGEANSYCINRMAGLQEANDVDKLLRIMSDETVRMLERINGQRPAGNREL